MSHCSLEQQETNEPEQESAHEVGFDCGGSNCVPYASLWPADAAGCLKGAVVGGVAGHYAGHHGLLGAGAGCLIGRHYENKHARQEMNNNTGYGSSRYNVGQYR